MIEKVREPVVAPFIYLIDLAILKYVWSFLNSLRQLIVEGWIMAEEMTIKNNLVDIAIELFRFEKTYETIMEKLDILEQKKYRSQFGWFSKRVYSAIEENNIKLVSLENSEYDPGMPITPLNIEEFATEDELFVFQMIEPIVMEGDTILREGTAILGKRD